MATRRRIPMVGDQELVRLDQVPVEPIAEPRIRREELSSEQEAREFDWDAWSDLMVTCLIVPRTIEGLVDYWKANINLLDWAKKVKPDVYKRIVAAFSARKLEIGGQ